MPEGTNLFRITTSLHTTLKIQVHVSIEITLCTAVSFFLVVRSFLQFLCEFLKDLANVLLTATHRAKNGRNRIDASMPAKKRGRSGMWCRVHSTKYQLHDDDHHAMIPMAYYGVVYNASLFSFFAFSLSSFYSISPFHSPHFGCVQSPR